VDESLLHDFRGVRNRDASEADIALLVARLLDGTVDGRAARQALAALAQRAEPGEPPWEVLRRLGFAGNTQDYDALENSNLVWVLESRRGIPITLGVVLMSVARDAGGTAAGINFPGHFLVDVNGVMVDPFVMQTVDPQAFLQRLPEASRNLDPARLFPSASPPEVGLRMLNNVKMYFNRRAAWDRILDVVDAQIALAPEHPALHLERGDLWRRLGLVAPARSSYREALALARSLAGDDRTMLEQAAQSRLDELGGADDVVH
jgi:regulator of sirC expression with transglutaminase-like and TPR domain